MALTHLILTKEYKVKLSRKECEETTVQRRMEHSRLTTTALRLGARTWARAARFLSPRCLSGTRKDLDISYHLFQSICWIHWMWGPLQILLFPSSLILSLPSPLPGRSCLSPARKDLSRSAHEEGVSPEGGGWQADAGMRMRQESMSGQVGGEEGLLPRRKGSKWLQVLMQVTDKCVIRKSEFNRWLNSKTGVSQPESWVGCEATEGPHQVQCLKWVPARPLYLETPRHVPNILYNRTGDELTPFEEMAGEKEGKTWKHLNLPFIYTTPQICNNNLPLKIQIQPQFNVRHRLTIHSTGKITIPPNTMT